MKFKPEFALRWICGKVKMKRLNKGGLQENTDAVSSANLPSNCKNLIEVKHVG